MFDLFKKLILTLLVLSFWSDINAQDRNSTIEINVQNISFPRLVDIIQSQSQVKIYYKEKNYPSGPIRINAQQIAVGEVLDQALQGSIWSYINYRDNIYVIVPARMKSELYSPAFYTALAESIENPQQNLDRNQEWQIGNIENLSASGNAQLSGKVIDATTGEPIIGATLFWKDLNDGSVTDENGSFSFELSAGSHELEVKYLGYEPYLKIVKLFSDGDVEIELEKDEIQLDEVTVSASGPEENLRNVQIGVAQLDMDAVKKLPSFLGEADVVKNLLLHPGVSSIGEGATGFNVRGGEVDQNLILQDEGFLFNSSHALGFFSTFNADLIRKVDLYKGNIPANYGGRLSSVMDVEMKDGDYQDFHLKAGISPITSKLSLEGPLIRDKLSIAGGFRSSYSDWILKSININEIKKSSAFFYDANARLSLQFDEKNALALSFYSTFDEFSYNEEFGFDYGTLMGQISLRNVFSDNLSSHFSVTGSQYNSTQFDYAGEIGSSVDYDIRYYKVKEQLIFSPNTNLELTAGLTGILYQVNPGDRNPLGDSSTVIPKLLEQEKGLEAAVFLNAEYSISPAFRISVGARYSHYQFLGPKTTFQYADSERPETIEIKDSALRNKNEVIASYGNIEPRFSLRYRINASSSVKIGYCRTAQYINQIFNSDAPTPTSQWQLSTEYIKPTTAHNFSVGYFRNFSANAWESSIELYYRDIDQLFDYKDFASLTVNEHLETELLAGIGRTYGLEMSLIKNIGQVNGRLAYTLSRSERMIEGISDNNWYPSNFDKTHDLNLVMNYQPNRRNTLTINFTFSTGRPTTPPIGNYKTDTGVVIPIYSERNQYRIPDYHRLDIAYTLGKGYRKDQKIQTSWTVSLYNVYARKNAFSVFYRTAALRQTQAYKLSVLGSMFPSLTLNLEIL